jgi:hypothetical protein
MKFCPVKRELCADSMITKFEPAFCTYGGIYRPFKDMKDCPKIVGANNDLPVHGAINTGG